jgi:DNA end-binding protein Ku
MPRSNWKGYISFGLVSIPISLYPTENKSADISFHQIDKKNNARIKYQRVNSITNKVVPWEDIIKGYELDKETTIPVPDEILKNLAGPSGRTIDIDTFIDQKDLDLLLIEKAYYIEPGKKGEKGYVILREALKDSKKIGIGKVIISTKEYLAAISVYSSKVLVLYLLRYDKELRKTEDLEIPTKEISQYKVNKKEVDIAKRLIDSMSSKWKPESYVDEYQKVLHEWVEEVANNAPHQSLKKNKNPKTTNIVDFVSLLQKSIKAKSKTSKPKSKKKPSNDRATANVRKHKK